ncbi:MAG: hypothetical protein ACK5IC_11575, partial [Moheibacter sp.]
GGKYTKITGGTHEIYGKRIDYFAQLKVRNDGVQGGVHNTNNPKSPPSPPDTLQVIKVEGPFDEKGNLVDYIDKGEFYYYRATTNREPFPHEVLLIKWDREYDDNGGFKRVYTGGTLLNDGKISFKFRVGTDTVAKKLTVYTYFEKRGNNAKVEVKLCKCPCCGDLKTSIKDAKEIVSYTGDFPSPFQVMRYTSSKNEPILHKIYVPDSTIRGWIKDAANYHGIPHEMITVIIQQENAPNSSKFRQFLQYLERTTTTSAAIIDEELWDIIPDKLADGSSGFMNMRRPTLEDTINYCKELMPKEIANREGYISDTNADTAIQGADWRADLYYGAAHIRQLIDRQVGKCSNGKITIEQVEKVFVSYNGSGPVADKYGKDAINLLNGAYNGTETLFFYEN